MVWPMKSRTGYIQYLQFVAGSNKGGVAQNEVFNDPFKLGAMTDNRVNYTAAALTENATAGAKFVAAWTPVVKGVVNPDTNVAYGAKIIKTDKDTTTGKVTTSVTYVDFTNNEIGAENFPVALEQHEVAYKVAYLYDNVVIPQNDLPILNAHMEGISLEAKARRIAVYYSQMAAFQAKTEMGIDLGEILATQACAELSYEIDSEVVKLLVESATRYDDLVWNKTQPIGVNKRDHFAGFAEILELGSKHIYDATQKHAANYMIASSSLKPILVMMDGYKAATGAKINGPYYAGEINGIKVYITPMLQNGEYVLGFNGDDMITSAAVFAPYMAIVPTQLLGYSDGSMSQGFSTLYDLKLLNKLLLVKGQVVELPQPLEITGNK